MSDLVEIITDDNFIEEVQNSSKPFLLDFWAPWCNPCLALQPVLDQLAEAYGDKIRIGKMNVSENATIPAQMAVRNIPRLVMFKDGEIVDECVGANKKKIIDMCETIANA